MKHSQWSWLILALSCLGACDALAQVPDSVIVFWSDDEFAVHSSSELSGSVGQNEGAVAWDVGDGHATITMSGSYLVYGPDFQLSWESAPQPFPLYLSADTSTGSAYYMEVKWLETVMESEAHTLTEDFEWGLMVPGGNRVIINLWLDEYMVEHDVTYTLIWGEGTPVEASTFGAVKALFR